MLRTSRVADDIIGSPRERHAASAPAHAPPPPRSQRDDARLLDSELLMGRAAVAVGVARDLCRRIRAERTFLQWTVEQMRENRDALSQLFGAGESD